MYKCTYANGDVTYSARNISLPEAQAFYIGETFNIDRENTNLQVCVNVELMD